MSFEQIRMNGDIIVSTKDYIIKNHKDIYICSMSAKKVEKHLMYQSNLKLLQKYTNLYNIS